MIEELLLALLVLLPLGGLWATKQFFEWHSFYGTRFLWGLKTVSAVSTVATVPIAVLAGRRMAFPEAEPFPGAIFITAGSLLMLEAAFMLLVLLWRDLDKDMNRVRKGREDESHSTNLPPGGIHNGDEVDV